MRISPRLALDEDSTPNRCASSITWQSGRPKIAQGLGFRVYWCYCFLPLLVTIPPPATTNTVNTAAARRLVAQVAAEAAVAIELEVEYYRIQANAEKEEEAESRIVVVVAVAAPRGEGGGGGPWLIAGLLHSDLPWQKISKIWPSGSTSSAIYYCSSAILSALPIHSAPPQAIPQLHTQHHTPLQTPNFSTKHVDPLAYCLHTPHSTLHAPWKTHTRENDPKPPAASSSHLPPETPAKIAGSLSVEKRQENGSHF